MARTKQYRSTGGRAPRWACATPSAETFASWPAEKQASYHKMIEDCNSPDLDVRARAWYRREGAYAMRCSPRSRVFLREGGDRKEALANCMGPLDEYVAAMIDMWTPKAEKRGSAEAKEDDDA